MTVFHSGHLSHLLKLSDQPYRHQKTLTAGDFSGDFFRQSPFPTPTRPSGAQGGDLQVLSMHRREILSQALATRVSSSAAWTSRADAKQSPRAWFSRFSSVVQEFGMFRSTADHSVFYHHNSLGQCIYLVVYVDDIVITSSGQNGIQKLKQHFFTHF